MDDEPREKVTVFYSYSHRDEELRDQLDEHLTLLKRQDLIETWHDREISAGSEWAGQIDGNLEEANIVLLLVSSSFIASDYCYEKEMKRALERHEKKDAVVVPIVLRECDWHSAPFGKLQALPKDGQAVQSSHWNTEDAAFKDIAAGLRRLIASFR